MSEWAESVDEIEHRFAADDLRNDRQLRYLDPHRLAAPATLVAYGRRASLRKRHTPPVTR